MIRYGKNIKINKNKQKQINYVPRKRLLNI